MLASYIRLCKRFYLASLWTFLGSQLLLEAGEEKTWLRSGNFNPEPAWCLLRELGVFSACACPPLFRAELPSLYTILRGSDPMIQCSTVANHSESFAYIITAS